MKYLKTTIIGVSWLGAFRALSRLVAFGKIIILARLLTPSQFGIFGIASLVFSFLDVITETGINVLLVQKREGITKYINDAWVLSIIRGFFVAFCIVASAQIISGFFRNTGAYALLYLISVVPIVKGFINPAIIQYQKELQFHKEFYFRFIIFLFDSFIAILVTFMTKDPLGIVWGLIAGAFLEVLLSFLLVKPRPRFKLHKAYVKDLFQKGKWVTGYVIFNYIGENGDNFIVGRLLGSASLGVYQLGYKISTIPISEISDVVNRVVFPVYVKISDDKERIQKAFFKTISVVFLLSGALSLVLLILPAHVFVLILGNDWLQVVPIVRILAIYGAIRAVTSIPSAFFLALHKQSYIAGMTFVRLIALVVTIIPFTLFWGLIGASMSALFSAFIEIPLIVYYVSLLLKNNRNK